MVGVFIGKAWAITVHGGHFPFTELEEARAKAMQLSRRWGGAAVRIREWDLNLSEPRDPWGKTDIVVKAAGRETVEEYLQRGAIIRCPPGHGFTPTPVSS